MLPSTKGKKHDRNISSRKQIKNENCSSWICVCTSFYDHTIVRRHAQTKEGVTNSLSVIRCRLQCFCTSFLHKLFTFIALFFCRLVCAIRLIVIFIVLIIGVFINPILGNFMDHFLRKCCTFLYRFLLLQQTKATC